MKTKNNKADFDKVFRGVLYEYKGKLIVLQRPEDKYNVSMTYLAAHYGLVPAELDKGIQLLADKLTAQPELVREIK